MTQPISEFSPPTGTHVVDDSFDPLIKISDVESLVGLKKSTIYNMIKAGTFPTSISLGIRARGWLLSDINRWKQERIKASREGV